MQLLWPELQKSTQFGYSRKDVILIGAGLIAFGYVLYYGLQATGMEPGIAGNWVQLIIFLGICVGWIGSYLFRVANKVYSRSSHSSTLVFAKVGKPENLNNRFLKLVEMHT
jgi:hypothetical protein